MTIRANTIIAIAESQGKIDQLTDILFQVSDMDDLSTSLHRAIRTRYQSEDDFDDLVIEIDHAQGKCSTELGHDCDDED